MSTPQDKQATEGGTDYRSTVFLPTTDFPMKAGLPAKEPELLKHWAKLNLYRTLREQSKGRELFVLHDGPPYANGNLHIGHALNKILKDVINRSRQMMGFDANYVPGWDCHGLPIEWKIEEKYRAAGKNKDDVPIAEFRQECRDFADHWINVQREEFKRFGVIGDWDNPYTTMNFAAEAQIVREIQKFLMNGGLFKGSKPVLWSIVERTALAEAEVEYHEHTSDTVFVKFPLIRRGRVMMTQPNLMIVQDLIDQGMASVVIWTTTPWTLPGNRAIAFNKDETYSWIAVTGTGERSLAKLGDVLVVGRDLRESFAKACGLEFKVLIDEFSGRDFVVEASESDEDERWLCAHPLRGQGYEFNVPLLAGDFVTMDAGTGFVHIAPGHGADDYNLGTANGIEVPHTVDEDGRYFRHVPLFGGDKPARVYDDSGKPVDANRRVMEAMAQAGALLGRGRLRHQYPHSWRSKAPLIFRNTPQWFISMATNDLRKKALAAIEATEFFPSQGRTRLYSMIEQRPDWVISRQRAWGVPITVFEHKETGELLRDEVVNERVVQACLKGGADAWFTAKPEDFLGNRYNPAEWKMVTDILDVWFDSGSTHAFVLEQRPDLKWPASLYLEGSDQHRGWFHSSLLESCGTRGRAPYDAVLTHGFTLDEKGRKMSKSLGNAVEPQDVIKQSGADILRLWVVSTDYTEDQSVGPAIIQANADAYRRLRNTLRYLLGNLAGFQDSERLPRAEMPPLERWVLHRLAELDRVVKESCQAYDFHRMYVALYNFCAVDLSSFYFDIRKDAVYCDAPDSIRRRAARTVLDVLFMHLTAWLAPFICFTAEEAWLARFPGEKSSVHLRTFPDVPAEWLDPALAAKWDEIRDIRRVVTGALEIERKEKRIGSSLQAGPVVHLSGARRAALDGIDFAETCITSGIEIVEGDGPADAFRLPDVAGVAVVSKAAQGHKCQRCWQVLPEVGKQKKPDLCRRCDEAVA